MPPIRWLLLCLRVIVIYPGFLHGHQSRQEIIWIAEKTFQTLFRQLAPLKFLIRIQAELPNPTLRTLSLDFREGFDRMSHNYLLVTLKVMATEWNLSHSLKRDMVSPSPRYKLMATLQDPFPYNVPLHKAAQWAWYYSLWFWIRWYVCWSEILGASELYIGEKKNRYLWPTPMMSQYTYLRRHEQTLNYRCILLTYKRTTGARMNICKNNGITAGSCDKSMNMLNIPYYQKITVLGFRFTSIVAPSGNVTWTWARGKIKFLARGAYGRDLCLKQRIQYVQKFLLSKIWRTAGIFSTHEGVRATNLNVDILVHMAWC